jgi:tetratricopeptide (TPR) repeat protein
VNDFLRDDLLGQASANSQARPDTKPDPDLTVRTALDRAAARIAGKFGAQPRVEASIRLTMGNTYMELVQYPEAQREIERALGLRRLVLGEEHLDTLTAISELGVLYQGQGKYAEAETLFIKALEVRRRVLGPDPNTTRSMVNLSEVWLRQRKYAEAEPLLREALSNYEKLSDSWQRYLAQSELGGSLAGQRKYLEAEPLLLSGYQGMIHREGAIPKDERSEVDQAGDRIVVLYQDWGRPEQAAE